MHVARSLRLVATAALSSMAATLVLAGPMSGTALAAPKARATAPTLTATPAAGSKTLPGNVTNSKTMVFSWTPVSGQTYTCALDATKAVSCTNQASYGPLPDGSHTFTLKVRQSGYRPATSSYTWSVDTTAPAQPTVNPVTSPTKNTSVTVTWADSDPSVASYQCLLVRDGVTVDGPSDCTGSSLASGSKAWTGLTDDGTAGASTYTAQVWALDNLGNPSPLSSVTPGSVTWKLDSHAPSSPTFVASSLPANPTNVPSADFQWTDTDFGGGAVTAFNCLYDGASVTPCDNTGTTLSSVADGTHTFSVQGIDAAGNVGNPTSFTWTVMSTVPPAPVVTSGPVAPGQTTDVSNATFYFGDAEPDVSYRCALDSTNATDFIVCPSPQSYSGLSDGPHTFYVKAVDAAGNSSDVTSYGWTIDTSPTSPVTVSAPAFQTGPATYSSDTNPAFTWVDIDGNTDHDVCSLDGSQTWQTCASGAHFPVSVQGPHVLALKSVDAAGNASPAVDWTWNLDTTAPTAPVFSTTPAKITNSTNAVFSFASDMGVQFTCSLDGAAPATLCASPVTYPGLTDGSHTFTVTATDAAGNSSSSDWSWTINTAAPTPATVNGPTGYVASNSPSITWTDSDSTVVSSSCTLDSTPIASCQQGSTPVDLGTAVPLGDGSHTFTVTVSNGSATSETTINWVVDTVAPVLHVNGVPSGTVNATTVTPSITQDEANPGSVSCVLSGPTPASDCGPYLGLRDGAYTLTVDTTDLAGNKANEVTDTWTVDSINPVLNVTGVPSGTVAPATVTPQISENDANPGSWTCSLTGTVSQSDCGPYSNLPDGSYTLTVNGADAAGNPAAPWSQSWTFSTPSNPTPSSPTTPTTTPTTSPTQSVPSAPTDPTKLTVRSLTAMGTLTGTSTATFSETVHGLAAGGAALYASTVVPSIVTCLSGTTAVSCSGSFTSLQVRPKAALVPGQYYSVRLAAGAVHDAAGNPLVAKSVYFRGSLNEQESSLAAAPTWVTVRAASAYGRSLVRESLSGASATYSFYGPRVTWWTVTGRNQGKAAVYIDGKRKAYVNNYAAATHYKVARKYARLGKRWHTIRIAVLGVKGAKAATGTFVSVDAFTVGTKRVNTPSLAMTWHVVANRHFSGGHAIAANAKGETLTFRFRGTSIAWFTEKARSQGKVAVYVDGVRKAVVDNYATRTGFGVKRVVSRLANKLHTLKLVVLGTHHKGGTGTWLTVDRFLVG